jgi:hypothetical protein
MIILNLVGRKARIWIGEMPFASCNVDRSIESFIEASAPSFKELRCAAVELIEHRGGRILYGLLGAELRPNASENLHLQINISSTVGAPFVDSIDSSKGKVFIGLPQQYADGVLAGVLTVKDQLNTICVGDLLFNCAAYHDDASTQAFFSYLSNIVVRILSSDEWVPSKHEIAALFQEKF